MSSDKKSVDFLQTDTSSEKEKSEKETHIFKDRRTAIRDICDKLSYTPGDFSAEQTYGLVSAFIGRFHRWMYSDISNYLFRIVDTGNFMTNLEHLQDYAYQQEKKDPDHKICTAIDKLWDHANLVQSQMRNLHDDEEVFSKRFEKEAAPFEERLTSQLNSQVISLVAIFTALSFIVFGGISSLDNVFSGAVRLPILKVIIVGCVWSLCISNLVLFFMYFVAKIVNKSISSENSDKNDGIFKRYPVFFWTNFLFVMILAASALLYFNVTVNREWLLSLTGKGSVCLSAIAVIVIAFLSYKIKNFGFKRKSDKKDE